MINKKMLVNANDFFDSESEAFKRELEVHSMLVDIACEFIKYRANNNLSQKELAGMLGFTQAMVSKLESGEYNPTVKLLFEVAQKLNWNFKIDFKTDKEVVQYEFCDERKLNESQANLSHLNEMGFAS